MIKHRRSGFFGVKLVSWSRFLAVAGILLGLAIYRQPIQAQINQWATPTPAAEVHPLDNSADGAHRSGQSNGPEADCQSNATGNWSSAATWTSCGGTFPQNSDTVTILSGHTVTLDVNPEELLSVTINSGGTLDISDKDINILDVTNPLTVNGTLTGSSGGVYVTCGNGAISGSGTISLTGGVFWVSGQGETCTFGSSSGSNNWAFYDLRLTAGTSTAFATNTGGTGTITVGHIFYLGGDADEALSLAAGSRTWIFSGTTGSPFTIGPGLPTMNAETATFRFTGNNAGGNTTLPCVECIESSFYNLEVSNASETFVLDSTVTIRNNLTITAGTFDAGDAAYQITLNGNYSNSGTYLARGNAVVLGGNALQTLSGNMTGTSSFYQLITNNSSGTAAPGCEITGFTPSIRFTASATVTSQYTVPTYNHIQYNSGSTYTFNNITWNGNDAAGRIQFRNSAATGTWLMTVTGTQSVAYVNASRSDASGGNAIASGSATNVDCGNNTNWTGFTPPVSNPDSPATLAQKQTDNTVLATGATTNQTSVKFTASLTGVNPSTIQLCVEKDLVGTAFSNTEDSCGTGVSYTGTAVAASVTIGNLVDAAQYHWQARTKDASNNYSSWVAYGSNAESVTDFRVDVSGPTGPTNVTSSSHTVSTWSANPYITMTWAATTDATSGLAGYSYLFDTTASTTPDTTQDIATVTTVQSGSLTEGTTHYFHLRAVDAVGNWGSAVHVGPFTIDLSAPIGPTNLASSDHSTSVAAADPTITITWTRAIDPSPGSGLAGYSYSFTTASDTAPDAVQDVGLVTTVTSDSLGDGSSWYFHIRPVDAVGNWGSSVHLGPFSIDTGVTITPTPTSTPATAPTAAPTAAPKTARTNSSATPAPVAAPTPTPEPIPLVFVSNWNLLPVSAIHQFVFAPLPVSFQTLAKQIPPLGKTLTSLSIETLADLGRLSGTRLSLPTLTSLKTATPTDIVFAQTGNELVDLTIKLIVDGNGNARQYISTIAGSPLQLATRPNQPVESIGGQLIFKGRRASTLPKHRVVTATGWLAAPALAEDVPAETRLVAQTFRYSGPNRDGLYTAQVTAPAVDGEYEIITTYKYQNPTVAPKEVRLITVVDPEGYVYERVGSQEARVKDATVTLKTLTGGTAADWPAKEYLQTNPQITDQTGRYSFLVPPGRYQLVVTAPGYTPYHSDELTVEEGQGVHLNIELHSRNPLKQLGWPVALGAVVLLLGFIVVANLRRRNGE